VTSRGTLMRGVLAMLWATVNASTGRCSFCAGAAAQEVGSGAVCDPRMGPKSARGLVES
jgi:hypothetical protein